jgi:hypothetical protein
MFKASQEKKLGKLTVGDFFARFPTEDACLTHIMEVCYGLRHVCQACGVEGTFHKLTERRAFSCSSCGNHVYPCAGTIFQDSRTPLRVWFYAIYLFVTTRHGVSGKELERSLGVTYKTAWRMGQQIRLLMAKADGFKLMQGHVEMDEAYVGGRHPGLLGRNQPKKAIVFGMVERGGRTVAETVPDLKQTTLSERVRRNVKAGPLSPPTNLAFIVYSAAKGIGTVASITVRTNGGAGTSARRLGTTPIASKAFGTCLRTRSARHTSM